MQVWEGGVGWWEGGVGWWRLSEYPFLAVSCFLGRAGRMATTTTTLIKRNTEIFRSTRWSNGNIS
jgi:hypothetical protein